MPERATKNIFLFRTTKEFDQTHFIV